MHKEIPMRLRPTYRRAIGLGIASTMLIISCGSDPPASDIISVLSTRDVDAAREIESSVLWSGSRTTSSSIDGRVADRSIPLYPKIVANESGSESRIGGVDSAPPTLEEQLASIRFLLDMMTNNPFERSTSLGALCWSIREYYRGMMSEQTGEWLVSLLQDIEEIAVVDDTDSDSTSPKSDSHVVADNDAGPTGNTGGEVTVADYDTDYTFREAVQAVLDPEVKDVVFDGSLPPEYIRFAQSFYSSMEKQEALTTPTPFDIEALPGGSEIPIELRVDLKFCDPYERAPSQAIETPDPDTTSTTTTLVQPTSPPQPALRI